MDLYGLPLADRDRVIAWKDAAVAGQPEGYSLLAYFTDVIDQRRRIPGTDMLSQIMAAPGDLTDLELLGMSRRADYRVSDYSAGMKQRIAICRAVLHRPALLLLDEPDSNLDPEGREAARALIGRPGELRWQAEGSVTRVAVSHDPEKARSEADQVLELAIGGAPAAGGTAA